MGYIIYVYTLKPFGQVAKASGKSNLIPKQWFSFIRANPGKKETTDGSGSHVIFFALPLEVG